MNTKLSKEFDIQDYLINTEKDPKAFFKACIEEDPGDGILVRRELGELAKVCTRHSVLRISKIRDDRISKALELSALPDRV